MKNNNDCKELCVWCSIESSCVYRCVMSILDNFSFAREGKKESHNLVITDSLFNAYNSALNRHAWIIFIQKNKIDPGEEDNLLENALFENNCFPKNVFLFCENELKERLPVFLDFLFSQMGKRYSG